MKGLKVFKWLILCLIAIIMNACCNNQESNVAGKYINKFEQNAKHYIELKNDSTYLHYYKKNGELFKENLGSWCLLKSQNKIEIVLDNWTDFGYIDETSCDGCIRVVEFKNCSIIFSYDLPNEMNFYKEE
jgi:hypothetical protein